MSRCRLDELADAAAVAERLAGRGLSAPAAAAKAERFARAARALRAAGLDGRAEAGAFFVPGRVELLGKHTDYAGGRSVIAAAEQGFCLVAVPRDDPAVHAWALDLDARCEFVISPDLVPPVGHWSNYLMTVARRLARNFGGPLRGAAIAFASDLPVAAGMSSSSALMVSFSLALSAVNGLAERDEYRRNIAGPEDLAGYLATIENGQTFGSLAGDKGVGTFGGSEDHTAMLCCQAGRLSQYSYCPVRLERRIDFPADCALAIAASGVAAEKTGPAMAKYNRASNLARAVVELWNERTGQSDPHLAAALAGEEAPAAAERLRQILADAPAGGAFSPKELAARFEQFLAESEQIIPQAGDALARGDVAAFALQVDRSQKLAETLLGNQVPETTFLARSARRLGAEAASGFGAGFGGSVWALVGVGRAEALLAEWAREYGRQFPATTGGKARFFLTRPGPAAFALSDRLS